VWQSKAAAHASLEQWDQALADYAKAIELNVNCLSGIVARLNAAGRGQEAAKLAGHAQAHAEKLTADSPQAADYWYHVGLAQISLQRLDQAVACCTKAIELKPDYWEAWYDRGRRTCTWESGTRRLRSASHRAETRFWQAWHNRAGLGTDWSSGTRPSPTRRKPAS
jgi:superkiller protein 3